MQQVMPAMQPSSFRMQGPLFRAATSLSPVYISLFTVVAGLTRKQAQFSALPHRLSGATKSLCASTTALLTKHAGSSGSEALLLTQPAFTSMEEVLLHGRTAQFITAHASMLTQHAFTSA